VTADTIFALSSGSPPAAIAVMRISGPDADSALQRLSGRLPPARRASLVSLHADGKLLDRALALRFPGPGSATGEDLVELHLHGGRAVVAAVSSALAAMVGLRPAQPGEFTRRAFETGRIDLAEAEGLADLLQSETQGQREAALALASGALSRRVAEWQTEILHLSAAIEAILDFSDEGEVGEGMPAGWGERLGNLAAEISQLLSAPPVERLRDGIRVVIAGPPNAGKSSLLNALIGREAAIISPVPGTTRDLVEAPASIAGTPFLLIDTAGLRETDDVVEAIGVDKALSVMSFADLILWLGGPDEAPSSEAIVILLQAKSDLYDGPREGSLQVSSKTGEGVDELLRTIAERGASLLPREGELALNARQRDSLRDALGGVEHARDMQDPLVAAELLREARAAFDRVTGRSGVEDMLDTLFDRFCIGK
jgi:tRNA modification GTPase